MLGFKKITYITRHLRHIVKIILNVTASTIQEGIYDTVLYRLPQQKKDIYTFTIFDRIEMIDMLTLCGWSNLSAILDGVTFVQYFIRSIALSKTIFYDLSPVMCVDFTEIARIY